MFEFKSLWTRRLLNSHSLGAEDLCTADTFANVAQGLVVGVLFVAGLHMKGVNGNEDPQSRHCHQTVPVTTLTAPLTGHLEWESDGALLITLDGHK